jgi:hypothetical protein
MKIIQSKNREVIDSIKSQISDSRDLEQFERYLSQNPEISFESEEQTQIMASCPTCCKEVNVEVKGEFHFD